MTLPLGRRVASLLIPVINSHSQPEYNAAGIHRMSTYPMITSRNRLCTFSNQPRSTSQPQGAANRKPYPARCSLCRWNRLALMLRTFNTPAITKGDATKNRRAQRMMGQCIATFASAKSCEVGLSECGPRAAKSHIPIIPFERSRWRGRRFACYTPRVMPQLSVLILLFHFRPIFGTPVNCVNYRRKSIQFP